MIRIPLVFFFYRSTSSDWLSLCDFTQGPSGPPGDDGIHVQNATVNGMGDLIVTLTDGTIINAGYVVGPDGAQGPQGDTGAQGPQGEPVPQGPQGDCRPARSSRRYWSIKVHKEIPWAQMVQMEMQEPKVHRVYKEHKGPQGDTGPAGRRSTR